MSIVEGLIDERFAIEERVGGGAFGDVFRGIDRATGERVAVKCLREKLADGAAVDRFALEARLLAAVSSPHVVRFVASGFDATGRQCLVLEWLDGEDLARRRRHRALSLESAVDIVRQAALGLDALHAASIVHRDVKPSNFFVTDRPDGGVRVKLIDLGVARVANVDLALTLQGMRIGTPVYMSPEQARGDDDLDPRSDLFSLGVVLFELLSGRRPFSGQDPFAVLAKIVLQDAPKLSDLVPGTAPDLDAILQRALARKREERFHNAREFADELAAADLRAAPPPVAGESHDAMTAPLGPLTEVASVEQRIVTGLFVGFGRERDPEQDATRFTAIAASYGGTTHRMLGGRAVALFGVTRSRGDEVIRAANAALETQRTFPSARLAISTSGVVSGAEGLSGDGIDRGVAQLERAGRGIRIDEATARMLQDRFEVESPEHEPMLRGERPETGHAIPKLFGRITPTVGRDRELGMLDVSFDECVDEPVARAILLTGAAGIGKSRVRFEFIRRTRGRRPDLLVLAGRGNAVGAGSAFGMLAAAIRNWAGVLDGAPPDARREKLHAALAGSIAPDALGRVSAFLGELIRIPPSPDEHAALRAARHDPILLGDGMRAAFEDWIAAESARRPVLVVFDDLQWGDMPSLQFVDAAVRNLHDRALMVLGVARPELHEVFPKLWSQRAVQEIRVGPLTRKASQRLVTAALGETVGDDVVRRVVDRAEGNAFHLEELLRAVASGQSTILPDTVRGMVQSRLDALSPHAKRLLRVASVYGLTFWRGAVEALLNDEARSEAAASLDELVSNELVLQRADAAFPDEIEYAFRNALIHEAVYATLLDQDRSVAHAMAGEWLERNGGVDALALAEHFEKGSDRGAALRWYMVGAEQALAGNDFAATIERAERAVACGAADDVLGRLRLLQAEAHRWRGEIDACARGAHEALDLLSEATPAWFRALGEAVVATGRLGRLETLSALALRWCEAAVSDEALPIAIATGSRAAGQCRVLGFGERAAQVTERLESLAARVTGDEPLVVARIAQNRSKQSLFEGDVCAYLQHCARAAEHFDRGGDQRNAALERLNVAHAYVRLGLYAECERAVHEALPSVVRLGLTSMVTYGKHVLTRVLVHRGEIAVARAMQSEIVRVFSEQGDPRLASICQAMLAEIVLADGDMDAAERCAREAVERSAKIPAVQVRSLAALARVLLARGDAPGALVAATDAISNLEHVHEVEDGEDVVRLVYAQALHATGDLDRARDAARIAREKLLARAERITDPRWREQFLRGVPEHAATLALAESLLR